MRSNMAIQWALVLILVSSAMGMGVYEKVEYRDKPDIKVRLLADPFGRQPMDGSPWTPVVLWHGMGDTAFGSINIDRVALKAKFPNMTVFSIQIGDNAIEDELGGYFVNVNYQIEQVCQAILKEPSIKAHGAFNAIGFSQGAQFMRGLLQRCPLKENGIRMKNLISLGGQHQGVFGLPVCPAGKYCDHIRSMLTHSAYEPVVQDHLVQAEYWHDPTQEDEYREKNVFLADINNERAPNELYRNRIVGLDNLVLVQFMHDQMVVPKESSLFGFYANNDTNQIVPLADSEIYSKLGLIELERTKRLHMIKVPGNHLQYKISWFINQIASTYLNN